MFRGEFEISRRRIRRRGKRVRVVNPAALREKHPVSASDERVGAGQKGLLRNRPAHRERQRSVRQEFNRLPLCRPGGADGDGDKRFRHGIRGDARRAVERFVARIDERSLSLSVQGERIGAARQPEMFPPERGQRRTFVFARRLIPLSGKNGICKRSAGQAQDIFAIRSHAKYGLLIRSLLGRQ